MYHFIHPIKPTSRDVFTQKHLFENKGDLLSKFRVDLSLKSKIAYHSIIFSLVGKNDA